MRHPVLRAAFGLLALVMVGISLTAWQIHAYSRRSAILHADAAIVLGAALWGEEPSPVFRERIRHAVALYHLGYVDKIIFTGGQGSANEPAEAIVGQRYAIARRVPGEDILVEMQSRTTEQSLTQARDLARKHHLETCLLVSDPLHMRRATRIARDLGMCVHPSPTPTTMVRSRMSKLRFLIRETRLYLLYLVTNGAPAQPTTTCWLPRTQQMPT